jgi:hypothetical protein
MINELQPSTLTRNRHTIENDRREVRHVSERLQEILDEASRKVREWPEWRKSEALKESEQSADSGRSNSGQQDSAGTTRQRNTVRRATALEKIMIELQPSTLTRNRHTVENDTKTALIKRINTKLKPRGLKVRVDTTVGPYLIDLFTGAVILYHVDLTTLAAGLGVQNATACVNVCAYTRTLTDNGPVW